MKEKLIRELVQTALSQLAKMGLSDTTLKQYQKCAFYPSERFYETKKYFNTKSSPMIEMYRLFLLQYTRGDFETNFKLTIAGQWL